MEANEFPPSVPRNQDDGRATAASSSGISPYTTKKPSARLAELLDRLKQLCLSTIVMSSRRANRATVYLPFNPRSEIVREIEDSFNKKSHHCFLAVFFQGGFSVGGIYDTVILPLVNFGMNQVMPAETTPGQALNRQPLDWSGQQYFVVTGNSDFFVDGGKLASVVVAFERDKNKSE